MRTISTDDIALKSSPSYATPLDSRSASVPFRFLDKWHKQPAPNPVELIGQYKRIAYCCANLNVNAILNAKLRLYTNKPSRKLKTAKIDYTLCKRLVHNPRLKLSLASQSEIEEVTDHDFLDLWTNPNPWHDACDFVGYYQLYQEVIGATYIQFIPNRLGQLQEWWVLPSQHVKPWRDGRRITGYTYCGERFPMDADGTSQPYIKAFPMRNPLDPYSGVGYSPLQASFESINLEEKMIATEAAILDNEGRPSGILSPKEQIGSAEAGRWEHKYNAKLRQSGSGNILVAEEEVDFTPITFPPKDLAALEMAKASRSEVALAFGVPTALIETEQFNRATLDASILQHVRQAVWPRLRDLEAKLNKHVVSLYGDNLFVAFDDPSPESQDLVAGYLNTLVSSGIITPNEARLELDRKPLTEGEALRGVPGSFQLGQTGETAPDMATDQPAEDPTADKPADPTAQGSAPTDNVQATALNGAQIQALQTLTQSVADGTLPSDSARGIIAASFPNLTAEQINNILNPLDNFEPPKPEAPTLPPNDPAQQDQPPQEPPSDQGKSVTALNTKAHDRWQDPPIDDDLEKVAKAFFEKYRKSALAQITKDASASVVRKAFKPLDSARDELASESRPFIEIVLDRAAKQLLQRVGTDEDVFSVTNPETAKAIDQAAFDFADSTNESTTLALNDALAKLRETMSDSLSAGDRLHEITKRVNEIFDGLSQHRAKLIAQTESSRAHHLGQVEAAKASGVVTGFEWLLSPDACPICQGLKGKTVAIGENFTTQGDDAPAAYRNVQFPPAHPGCRCALLEVLDIDN
jgi:HK97 family phage portal protein